MDTTPELSDRTSIQLRIAYWKDRADPTMQAAPDEDFQPKSLMPFAGDFRQPMHPDLTPATSFYTFLQA